MTCRYSIVQYVPDPITDERINVGVIVVGGDGRSLCHFVGDWTRARHFGAENVDFLRDVAEEIEQAVGGAEIDLSKLASACSRWDNAIQMTEPRGSLDEPPTVLEQMAARFLRERARAKRRPVRFAAASHAASALEDALGDESHLVHRRYSWRGNLTSHTFDLGLANGHALLLGQGLVFTSVDTHELMRNVDATAWMMRDVRDVDDVLPLALLYVAPAKGDTESFLAAKEICKGLRVEMVPDSTVSAWSGGVAARVRPRASVKTAAN